MKRIAALLLACVMAFSLLSTASAASLTLKNSKKETETAPKKTLVLKETKKAESGSTGGLKLVSPSANSGTFSVNDPAKATAQAMGLFEENVNLSGKVSRAQFARMLVAYSAYKDNIVGSAGVSLFSDVKQDNGYSGYIKAVVSNGWMSGYIDGSFRPNNAVKLEEAAAALLKVLGYSTANLVGIYPAAQVNKYKALGLGNGVGSVQGQTLTWQDCVTMFYNLLAAQTRDGRTYASTLGYAVNSDGTVNYLDVITGDLEGPYVLSNSGTWDDSLPFSLSEATVYYNGVKSKSSKIGKYDVVYYNVNSKTIWAYHKQVSGLITAVSPSGLNPATVTVVGQSYPISSSTAAYKLSSMGSYQVGEVATLILGMNNDVVDVVNSTNDSGYAYGVVSNVQIITFRDEDNDQVTAELITILDDTGSSQQYVNTGNFFGIPVGNPVAIRYQGLKAKAMERLSEVELIDVSDRRDMEGEDGDSYELGANAAVFLKQNNSFTTTVLPSVANLSGYTIYGYYDDVLKDDGEVYVVIAVKE